MRLVELWRISPPNYGGHALAAEMGTYPSTTLAQEEAMAQVRYERQQAEAKSQSQNVEMTDDMMSDGEQSNAPLTPIQGGDGRWCTSAPEPYMMSGYEALARKEYEMSAQVPATDAYSVFGTPMGGQAYKKATDPVYANQGWARTPEEQELAMASQYGMHQVQRENMANMRTGAYREDEEML